jgi:cysteine desulfurase/selenocysteine lyase
MKVQTGHIEILRDEFPLLHQQFGEYPLIYLDNAATTQKPLSVIESITEYYTDYNANIHRGIHRLATKATEAFEASRTNVQSFIHAAYREEIIFTSGTTGSINLVARSWGEQNIVANDEIIISEGEHHSNIVPWQQLAERKGAVLRVIPIKEDGTWDLEAFEKLLSPKSKLIAVNHVSNATGVIQNIEALIALVRNTSAKILVDGAQAVSHFPVDVQSLDCDFYCFSGHKLYGPTGIGVLYGKRALLEEMPPFMGGGEMIDRVSFEGTTYNKLPYKFEAGTPHIEGVIALGAALDFYRSLDQEILFRHEQSLLDRITSHLLSIPGSKIYGTSEHKVGIASFYISGIHPYDIGTLLDQQGIAVRTGHHCTQPLWERFGIPGSVRISFACYNTLQEVDMVSEALLKAVHMLK